MQGLNFEPSRIIVWTLRRKTSTPRPSQPSFKAPVEVAPRPAPVLPDPLSKLLPADVRAARRAPCAAATSSSPPPPSSWLYLGLIGWFGYGLWQSLLGNPETSRRRPRKVAPEGEAYALHIAKWDELAHAIDLTHSPVDILKRIAACIPPNSGLRLKTAEISATEIKLIGEAPQLQAVNTFSLNLSKNNELTHFDWQTPEPNQSTRGWEFVFTGRGSRHRFPTLTDKFPPSGVRSSTGISTSFNSSFHPCRPAKKNS